MADFITVTLVGGAKKRINVNTVWEYHARSDGGSCGSWLDTAAYHCEDTLRVTETPEQIDALLGVTDAVAATEQALCFLMGIINSPGLPALVRGLKASKADINADAWGEAAAEAMEQARKIVFGSGAGA